MKKITAIILFLSIILTTTVFTSIQSFAAEDDYDFVVASVDEGGVNFDRAYAKIGEVISVCSDSFDVDSVFYKWYIDNKQINNYGKSYTPCEDDLESMLTVEVFDKECEFVGRKSILISTLPVVYVETDNRKEIKYKSTVLQAQMKIQGNDEFNDSEILYDGKTEIKGRGNSTWLADKKPYKIKLDSKSNLLGMGKNKHWVLLSNPFDSSNIRNTLSYNLSGDMGLNYQKSEWVELVLNGRVVGLYQLCEHVRVDKERVNITSWDDIAEDAAKAIYKANQTTMTKAERDELIDFMTDDMRWTTSDSVTFNGVEYIVSDYFEIPDINGGYLLEIDKYEQDICFTSPSGMNVSINKPEGISEAMLSSISEYYNAFETALFSNDFCTEYNGKRMRYTDFIEVDSFAKAILINELFGNTDFGYNSTFISKEIDGKLVFGPIWDMDSTSPLLRVWSTASKAWIKRMLSDPVLMNEIRDTYLEYRYNEIQNMIKFGRDIDSYCSKINSAAVHNDKIWHNEIKFMENVNDLRYKLQLKINWLDKQLFSLDTAVNSVISTADYKKFITSDSLKLSLTGDTLNILCNNSPAEIEIFTNGTSFKKVKSPKELTEITLPPVDNATVITAVAYDSVHTPLYGSFITTERYVESLDVVPTGNKTYNVGEVISFSDFNIIAHYSNGTQATVTPDLVYTYAKNSSGIQYFSYGEVTETLGDVYVVFMYKNAFKEISLNVNKRDNSTDVSRMIAELPENCTDSRAIKMLLDAKIAYNSLTPDAAKAVDVSKLNSEMGKLAEYSNGKAILGCHIDGLARINNKCAFIVIVKGSPRSIIITNSENSTNTYTRASDFILGIKKIDDYEIWTIYRTLSNLDTNYTVRASYPAGGSAEILTIANLMFIAEQKPVTKIVTSSYAVDGKAHSIKITTSSAVEAVKLVENGKEYNAKLSDMTADFTLTLTELGKHSFKVFCLINGSWLECDNVDIIVRETVPTDSHLFFTECEPRTYNARAKARIITEKDVESVSLISGDDTRELTCVSKNGFKIWSGTFPRLKDYTVSVGGVDTSITLNSGILGDINGDGSINSLDALYVLQASVGSRIPTDEELVRGDMNTNGRHDSEDALVILYIATGRIPQES